jgi:tetratricopeptide (TPR) repeat protein
VNAHYFISYSRIDGAQFALRLADDMAAGSPSYQPWVDVRKLQPGQQDWDRQLVDAIKTCAALVFVMSEDSVRDESGCKPEWVAALRYKRPLIPVRVASGVELPFRLSSRQFIDFSPDFGTGLTRLRNYFAWTETPEGVLQDLRSQFADAARDLPRAAPDQQRRIEDEIKRLRRRIEEQEQLVANPQAVAERTEARIDAGLESERGSERPVVRPARVRFVNRPPAPVPSYFRGREGETRLIRDFLSADERRLLWVVGRGGVGKTALVSRILTTLEGGRLPDGLGELAVNGIVYLSSGGAHATNFPNMFDDLCRLVPEDVADVLRARYRASNETPAALTCALLEVLPEAPTVLLLDRFEDVVDQDRVGVRDNAMDAVLRAVLTASPHGLKVIVTTRVTPRDLLLFEPGCQQQLNLDEGLPSPLAEQVLRDMDPDGSLGLRDAPMELLTEVRERTRGFPRALEAIKGSLAADREATLAELLAQPLPHNVVEALVGEAFSRLDSPGERVMEALASYPVPVPTVAVDYLLQPYDAAVDSAPVLSRLVNMQFVHRDAGRYNLHDLDRDYALQRVPIGTAEDRLANPPRFSRSALWLRGAEYFREIRTPSETWRTLDDLAPQLTEFKLRYQAGDYDGAARVLLAIDRRYLFFWGQDRLVVDLHEQLRGLITNSAMLIASNQALGMCLAALGQVGPAIEHHEEAVRISRAIGARKTEADNLGSLGWCHRYLGKTRRAIELLEEAVAIEREIGDRESEASNLSNLGLCYAALGQTEQAIELQGMALDLHRERARAEEAGELIEEPGRGELIEQSGPGEFFDLGLPTWPARAWEATDMYRLGLCYADLGELDEAVGLYVDALERFEALGPREAEALTRIHLGSAYGDQGRWAEAKRFCRRGVEIADELHHAEGSSEGRLYLATAQLHDNELGAARETTQAARAYAYQPTSGPLAVIDGITALRQGNTRAAQRAFSDALSVANAQIEEASDNLSALDTKGLALCGLALADNPRRVDEAAVTFRAARAVSRAPGIVGRVLRTFDILAAADERGILGQIRGEAGG